MVFMIVQCALFVYVVRISCAENTVRTYQSSTSVFQVQYSDRSDTIFVGGRNKVFHLDRNLTLTREASINLNKNDENVEVHNDVKIMLICCNKQALLVCGSANKGMCHLRPLSNITATRSIGLDSDISSYVAGTGTNVAFFSDSEDLYVAKSYNGSGLANFGYMISAKVIHFNKTAIPRLRFYYVYDANHYVTGLNPVSSFLTSSQVKYIYGFVHESEDQSFSYFLQTQWITGDVYETRLARVCHDDLKFFSYSEIPLHCLNQNNKTYNLAITAYLGNANKLLKMNRDMDYGEKALYVVFGKNDKGQEPLDRFGSVLCMFPMSQLERAFYSATRDCIKGIPGAKRLKTFLGGNNKCFEKKDQSPEEALCDPGINHYVEGHESIPGWMRASTNELALSLVVVLQHSNTVAFFVTKSGSIAKYVLESDQKQGLVYQVPLDVEAEADVQSSNALDKDEQNLYLLSGNKVIKFPIGSCTPHLSCMSCVANKDPLDCGWCGSYCAGKHECFNATFKNDQCSPFVSQVSPLRGHTNGGTRIKIIGGNLGSMNAGEKAKISVQVAGVECTVVKWEYEKVECVTGPKGLSASGPVVVKVKDTSYDLRYDIAGTAVFSKNFSYVTPKLFGLCPGYGAMSGGTEVTLVGNDLDVGSDREVLLAGLPCLITHVSENFTNCTTSSKPSDQTTMIQNNDTQTVFLKIDGHILNLEEDLPVQGLSSRFDYRPDPEVTDISPKATSFSGGTDLVVTGRHLDSVAHPKLVITVTHPISAAQKEVVQECHPGELLGVQLVCRTPSLEGVLPPWLVPTSSVPVRTHFHFLMDGVVSLRNFSQQRVELSQLLYYEDPIFQPFTDGISEVSTDTLELLIEGKALNLALRPKDVVVSVNYTLRCNVTQLKFDALRCVLPEELRVADVKDPFPVTVRAGNLEFHLGEVKLVAPRMTLSRAAAVGIAIGAASLLCIIFLILYKLGILRVSGQPKRLRNEFRIMYTPDGTVQEAPRNDYSQHPGTGTPREDHGACATARTIRISEETKLLLSEDNILFLRDYLTLGKEIGQGHFGRVYEGQLQMPGKEEGRQVAVKTLHNCRYQDAESAESFLQEGLMMKDFHNHNVLTLIGVCFEDTGFPMVILPFMKYGDLKAYIQDEENEPTVKLLIEFGTQVAEGMQYLSDLKFVHRDLAARNCMVDEDLTVKVADFGLSRDVYERDYYSSDNKKSKLPVKWMAPESLEKGTYSTKSDVWSFGVLLWELMTRGVTPYPEVGNWEILNYIKSGRRMLQPSYCPENIFRIMLRCWYEDPRKRPTFSELADEIRAVIKKMENKDKKVGLDGTYVNYPMLPEMNC